WEDTGRPKSQRLELLAVVFRVAERQVHVSGERRELLPPERREPEERGIERREVVGRRDVVILEHAPGVERGEGRAHRRGERVVENRDVAAPRSRIAERPDVVREALVYGEGE